jgi:hypothetical protein
VPTVGDDPRFIDSLADLVRSVSRDAGTRPGGR